MNNSMSLIQQLRKSLPPEAEEILSELEVIASESEESPEEESEAEMPAESALPEMEDEEEMDFEIPESAMKKIKKPY
jgi:vacuolar-type H+-ATPase subunit E/Vma4